MAASTASNLLPCLFLIITHKGNRFQVVPGQKVIIPRAHLLTTRKRRRLLRFPVVGFNGIMSRKEVN